MALVAVMDTLNTDRLFGVRSECGQLDVAAQITDDGQLVFGHPYQDLHLSPADARRLILWLQERFPPEAPEVPMT